MRYAVLADISAPDLRVVGIAIEQETGVRVLLDDDWGIKPKFWETIPEFHPNGNMTSIHPGTPAYFDYVIGSLGRTFLVREVQGESPAEALRTIPE